MLPLLGTPASAPGLDAEALAVVEALPEGHIHRACRFYAQFSEYAGTRPRCSAEEGALVFSWAWPDGDALEIRHYDDGRVEAIEKPQRGLLELSRERAELAQQELALRIARVSTRFTDPAGRTIKHGTRVLYCSDGILYSAVATSGPGKPGLYVRGSAGHRRLSQREINRHAILVESHALEAIRIYGPVVRTDDSGMRTRRVVYSGRHPIG